MKKLLSVVLAGALAASLLAGCSSNGSSSSASSSAGNGGTSGTELKKITVGASPTPHAEILEVIKDDLKAEGYDLEIVNFSDYVLPNMALENDELDANYFQHLHYMKNFNETRNTHLVNAAGIHYEPFGIYAGKTKAIADLKDGASIAVPNDTTNEARALLLLESQGLITLKEGAGINATVRDITNNPKNLKIKEIEAAQISMSLPDVDLAVINGNYAIQAGLKVSDALAKEADDSLAATTYINVVAVREGHENDEGIQALVKALKSEKVKSFIEEKYQGSVVALF